MNPKPICIIISFMLFIGFSVTCAAQNIQHKNDSVLVLFNKYFNARNTDSLYSLLGETTKAVHTPEAFRKLMVNDAFSVGTITGSSLLKFDNDTSTYKLNCTVVDLQLKLFLDPHKKINPLLLIPYKGINGNKPRLAASSNPLITATDKLVDTFARAYVQKIYSAGLSIGVFNNGKISLYNYGETQKDTGKLPDADTFYEIGSITKTFTGILLAWYVNEGKVRLDDPITKYLPDSVGTNKELEGITLLTLTNHTSGLSRTPDNLTVGNTDPLNPYKDYNKKLLYSYLKNCKLNSKPGEKYSYSNLAVGLLGNILENVSGKTFEQMVNAIICKPLGMKSTLQNLSTEQRKRFATGHNGFGKPTVAWDGDALAACGMLKSTVNDLLIYARANMHPGNDKLSKAMILSHQVTCSKGTRVGLGWHIISMQGIDYLFHNGMTGGFTTSLVYNADKNVAVVVLANALEDANSVATNIIQKLQIEP